MKLNAMQTLIVALWLIAAGVVLVLFDQVPTGTLLLGAALGTIGVNPPVGGTP